MTKKKTKTKTLASKKNSRNKRKKTYEKEPACRTRSQRVLG